MVRERSVHLAAWLGRLPPARIRYQDRILVRIGGVVRASVSAGYAVTAVKLDGVTEYTGVINDRDIILVGIRWTHTHAGAMVRTRPRWNGVSGQLFDRRLGLSRWDTSRESAFVGVGSWYAIGERKREHA